MKSRRTILAWMAGAWMLAIPYAIVGSSPWTTATGLFLLLVLPALEALLALLLINWRSVAAVWTAEKALFSLLLGGLCLTLAASAPGNLYVTALLLLPAIFMALVWAAASRLGLGWLAVLGVLLAAFLLLDASGLAGNHYVFNLAWLRAAYKIIAALGAVLAIGLAALCVYRAAEQPAENEERRRAALIALAMILVLGVALANLRYGVLTKATGRAYEDHFPLSSFSAAVIAGLVLALSLKGKARADGWAFLILAPAVLFAAYSMGWRIEPRAITDRRAEGIQRAIETYHQHEGRYPDDLSELSPGYLPVLLGPLTGRGQVWCYESSPNHYRLGYVVFERYHQYTDGTPFWEPYYATRIASSAGPPSEGPWICDLEMERFRLHGGL